MQDTTVLDYVRISAKLLGLSLDEAAVERVSGHFGRTVAMAEQLDAFDLSVEDEPVALFCPAPFPGTGARA